MTSGIVPLRVSKEEWNALHAERCTAGEEYLPYDLTVSPLGEVQKVKLQDYDGTCGGGQPLPPKPAPIVQAHLGEAEGLLRSMRFVPWIVDGRSVPVIAHVDLPLAPPEVYGPEVPFPVSIDPATVSIGLERGGCEGECPSYSVVIKGDGTVTYHGNDYVAVPGQHTTHISPATVTRLVEQFREARFLAALPQYVGAMDGSGAMLSLTLNGKTHQVDDGDGIRVGMPTKVLGLEHLVDAEAGTERWVRYNDGILPALDAEHWDFGSASRDNLRFYDQAIRRRDEAFVARFIAAGAPVFVLPSEGAYWSIPYPPPIVVASGMGDVSLVKRMLTTTTKAVPAPILFHSLLAGFGSGKVEMVNFWIDHGADPHAKPVTLEGKPVTMDEGYDPLLRAIASGNTEVVKQALNLGFNVNGNVGSSKLPLSYALENASPEHFDPVVVRVLLTAGADPNARDSSGGTALFQASSVEALKMLLAAGANPNARDKQGKTVLDWKSYDADALRVLLAAGADPTLREKDGGTILDEMGTYDDCPSCREEVSAALRSRGVNTETFYRAGHRQVREEP